MSRFATTAHSVSNDLNEAFYDSIELAQFTAAAGLTDCPDLRLLSRVLDLDPARERVLEVGSGTGRVVSWLLEQDFEHVSAIERSRFAEGIARDHAGAIASGRLQLHHQDIKTFASEKKFDLVLWMFSGITDFVPEEQIAVLRRLADLLADGGRLVLDLPPAGKTNATHVEGSTQRIEIPGLPTYYGTVPEPATVLAYGEELGFWNVQRRLYRPLADQPERDRALYFLSDRFGSGPEGRAAIC